MNNSKLAVLIRRRCNIKVELTSKHIHNIVNPDPLERYNNEKAISELQEQLCEVDKDLQDMGIPI